MNPVVHEVCKFGLPSSLLFIYLMCLNTNYTVDLKYYKYFNGHCFPIPILFLLPARMHKVSRRQSNRRYVFLFYLITLPSGYITASMFWFISVLRTYGDERLKSGDLTLLTVAVCSLLVQRITHRIELNTM